LLIVTPSTLREDTRDIGLFLLMGLDADVIYFGHSGVDIVRRYNEIRVVSVGPRPTYKLITRCDG